VSVEIAETEAVRARGLMFRETLAPDRGMLFLFEERGLHSFWMKNTLISLDILWLDSRGMIVSIAQSVPPCSDEPCPHYSPDTEACAVLEVISGFVKQHGVKVGAALRTAADLVRDAGFDPVIVGPLTASRENRPQR
jgi:uncharacterized membrane protein (UPF0127 family)